MTHPRYPDGTYVALYGSHGEKWRGQAKMLLDAAGIWWHDPTDSRWDSITHQNGDEHQDLIDQLVDEEHEGLLGAGCVVFHVEGGANPPASLAARFELGLMAGRGLPAFLDVEPNALGRNYIWAAMKRYPSLVRCHSLAEAVNRAIEWMNKERHSGDRAR